MSQRVVVSGMNGVRLVTELKRALRLTKPQVIGIVSAFVSVSGVELFASFLEDLGVRECRLVAGIDLMLTHPQALHNAQKAGWKVRIGKSGDGIFHPKLIISGQRFKANSCIQNPSFVYLGSGNLTDSGLRKNVECGIIMRGQSCVHELSDAFATIWQRSDPLTPRLLDKYSEEFMSYHRSRKPESVPSFGLTDAKEISKVSLPTLRTNRAPKHAVISTKFAVAAWTGLESFTGEYTFQVEFPRAAGEVVLLLIKPRPRGGNVNVRCEDGRYRPMLYRYYHHNSMFRLNVPNDVPGVKRARQHRAGIAIVERINDKSAPVSFRILQPGPEVDEIIRRSFLLGTWGKTRTRTYGWF